MTIGQINPKIEDAGERKKRATVEITRKSLENHAEAHGKIGKDPKPFHGLEHPETLIERAKKIAKVFGLSEKEIGFLVMALAGHDEVIEYDKPDPNDLLGKIVRHRGARKEDKKARTPWGSLGNEGQSRDSTEGRMRKAEIFTEEEIKIVAWAIEATYVDVEPMEFKKYPYYKIAVSQNLRLGQLIEDIEKRGIIKGVLFYQPHLETTLEKGDPVPYEVLITGLVDLAGAGMGKNEEFFKEGDAEMRELHYNIRIPETFEHLIGGDKEEDVANRGKVAQMFLGWLKSQIGFALWQALRFEKIIYLLKESKKINPEQEKGLRSLFCHYLTNVEATLDRAENLKNEYEEAVVRGKEKEAFATLAQSMHYKIPASEK